MPGVLNGVGEVEVTFTKPVQLFPATDDAVPEVAPELTTGRVPSVKPSRCVYGVLAAATVVAALLIAFVMFRAYEGPQAAAATQAATH